MVKFLRTRLPKFIVFLALMSFSSSSVLGFLNFSVEKDLVSTEGFLKYVDTDSEAEQDYKSKVFALYTQLSNVFPYTLSDYFDIHYHRISTYLSYCIATDHAEISTPPPEFAY